MRIVVRCALHRSDIKVGLLNVIEVAKTRGASHVVGLGPAQSQCDLGLREVAFA